MIDINLNEYAKKRTRQSDPFDFNTAKPQRTERSVGGPDAAMGSKLSDMLQAVQARIVYEAGQPVLRFDPPLERESVNPERWAKAVELEDLFWEVVERGQGQISRNSQRSINNV